MTYIILAAGKGTKLQPLTLKTPKSLYKLDYDITILQRMIRTIRKYDSQAEIVVVVGFMYESILRDIENENVVVVRNPFYASTGSIASLWFAKKYLERENVTIINSDIVFEDKLIHDVLIEHAEKPYVLIDTSKTIGKYNVQVQGDKICVMSKSLSTFFGQYACVSKLDAVSSRFLLEKIDTMVNEEMYDLIFEDALVQMIFEDNFNLYFRDIRDYSWTEVDSVDDLLKAKEVQKNK